MKYPTLEEYFYANDCNGETLKIDVRARDHYRIPPLNEFKPNKIYSLKEIVGKQYNRLKEYYYYGDISLTLKNSIDDSFNRYDNSLSYHNTQLLIPLSRRNTRDAVIKNKDIPKFFKPEDIDKIKAYIILEEDDSYGMYYTINKKSW